MEIAVVGINHNNAPIEIRERAAFTESGKIDIINEIMDHGICEAIIVSTCNRSEIYIVYKKKTQGYEVVREIYKRMLTEEKDQQYIFTKKDDEAIEHVFNVASGMDSIVLGEDQILGQVKDSLMLSMELGSSKKILNRLFRDAITAARQIKRELKISEIPLSTSYIGLKLVKDIMGSFQGKNVLIIGIGQISKLTLKYLLLEDLNSIKITNRTHGKLKELEIESDIIEIVKYGDRYDIINDVDIIISATSAPHIILQSEEIPQITNDLYILDLAVPRDIDPKIKDNEKIKLFDIDDLEQISTVNFEKRNELKSKAKEIIDDYIHDFNLWITRTKVDPVIRGLKDRCSEIERDSLEYIFRKADMESRERNIVQKMMNSALKRLIREPIMKLKEIDDEEERELYTKVIKDIFKL